MHKKKHLGICKQLVDGCGAEGDHCLERIVMGGETWIHQYEPDCKRPHSPTKVKFKNASNCRKADAYSFLGLTTAATGTLPR